MSGSLARERREGATRTPSPALLSQHEGETEAAVAVLPALLSSSHLPGKTLLGKELALPPDL